ncbi:cyclophane-containing RiPP biosynthesis TPR protein HaaT [Streptomyces sp. NPDC056188]|uniref:cyclophane-containing RiPP biosynthesis TPR protein HaaT n=1 Tax=Streptomyces sp. NPDC056188 TaxID=3345740 RepID=UPI0035DBE752
MSARRGVVVAVIASSGAVTTLLIGLVTNAVSEESNWPGWLAWFQDHGWLSFALLGVLLVVMSAALATISEGREPASAAGQPSGLTAASLPGAAQVLRSLPRDTAAFTNRSAELEALLRSVRTAQEQSQPLPVHVIDGMPGVGKTAFAVHAGHLMADRFPDGQLFMNLNGHTTGRSPVQAGEALAALLAAAGVPAGQIPVGEDAGAVTEARAAMWRTRLSGKRALLILDNAVSYRQLEPLLPGGTECLVLVTSRKRLAASEEVVMPVGALPSDHAVELFVRLSGRRPESLELGVVEEMVGLCGFLPLAISLLAARLRHHPSWSAEDLRGRLVAARDRLAELRAGERAVAAAFELSYQDLAPERQRFFRSLGFYPGTDLDAYAAAALALVSCEGAQGQLEALYEAHLIEEHPGHRYRLHDLLRDYARSLAGQGGSSMESVQAVRRLCGFYLAALAAANEHILRSGATQPAGPVLLTSEMEAPSFESRAEAQGWLESERANVLACIRRAHDLELYEFVVRLAAVMAPFLRQAGPWDQAVGLHRTAAQAARRTGDRKARAQALAELGVVRRFMAAYPEAVEALTEAADEFEAVRDRQGRADALNQLGIVHYLTTNNEAAASAQTEALTLYREAGDRLGQANALADLGMVRRQTSDFDASVEAQSEALAIYRDLGDRYGEANSLRDLGVVHVLTGDYAQAASYQRDALDIYTELADRTHQAYALNELGVVDLATGDLAGAREAHEQALELFTELGERFGCANSIRGLGAVERASGNAAVAVRLLDEALASYEALGSQGGEAAALTELGAARGLVGDQEAAEEAFRRSLEIQIRLGNRCGQAEVLNSWGALLCASNGEAAPARERFEQALALAREIGCPLEQARALEGIGRYAHFEGQADETESCLRQAFALYQQLGLGPRAEEVQTLLAAVGGA